MLSIEIEKAKTPELEAELALFREAGIEVMGDLTNNAKRVAALKSLIAEHGHPIRLGDEFINDNPGIAKFLLDGGMPKGEIVFAQKADLEEVKKAEEASEKAPTKSEERRIEEVKKERPLVYLGHKVITRVEDALLHGRLYKDIFLMNGESHRMSVEEFNRDVSVQ